MERVGPDRRGRTAPDTQLSSMAVRNVMPNIHQVFDTVWTHAETCLLKSS